MKILITGGCGFLGTNIALYLNSKGFNVSSLENLYRKGSLYNFSLLEKKSIKNYKFDISNYNYIKKLPKFNLIIDCCAEASVEISRKDIDKVFKTNLIGTFNILKKARTGDHIWYVSNIEKFKKTIQIGDRNMIQKKN